MHPKSCATGSATRKVFRYNDIASVMVEDGGEPHTMNLFEDCHTVRQDEKEPRLHRKSMEEKSSRSEEIARQAVGWFGCTWLGESRSRKSTRPRRAAQRAGGIESGSNVDH